MQAIRAIEEAFAGERHGGARGQQINNFGKPWKKFIRKQGVGGNVKGDLRSRYQGRVERQIG